MSAYPSFSKKFGRRIKKSGFVPRLKMFLYVLTIVSVVLIFFWGEFGFFRMWVLHRRVEKLEKDIINLKVIRQDLAWEIDKMKYDPDYLLRYAVENYGYARSDQRIIQFVPADSSAGVQETGSNGSASDLEE